MVDSRNVHGAIQLLRACTPSRPAIVSESIDESVIVGTRPAFINLAIALLEMVEEYDNASNSRQGDPRFEQNAFWSSGVASIFFPVAGDNCCVVSCGIFECRSDLIDYLEKCAPQQGSASIKNDPEINTL
jgi:hypothetical protein